MSPARAEEKRVNVRANVARNRFMGSPLNLGDARFLTSERIDQLREFLATDRRSH
jgi:hypothetical protein